MQEDGEEFGGGGDDKSSDHEECGPCLISAGSLVDIQKAPHRIVAVVIDRVLICSLTSQSPYLVQEADGSLQLPTIALVQSMIKMGTASLAPDGIARPSASRRMREQIRMLDAADVPQGDKAIWIHLASHWTASHVRTFGPHDDPWKIRRWRSALRAASGRRRARTSDPRDASR